MRGYIMPKRCIICGEQAEYLIKDTSDYYCKDCAEESFGDVSMLVKVEEQAKLLKKLVDRAGRESKISEDRSEDHSEKISDNKSKDHESYSEKDHETSEDKDETDVFDDDKS
jgi:hypothetical protein